MSSFKKKRIWVTGGAGFIGSHLVKRLCEQGHQVIVLDNFSSGKRDNLTNLSAELVELDIRDENKLEDTFNLVAPDVIYHLAAISSVSLCEQFPTMTSEINLSAGEKLLQLAIKNKVKKFIFSSSAAIYGEQYLKKNESISEENKPNPISLYGADKLELESVIRAATTDGLIEGISFRFFNVYGENQDPSSPYSGVLSIFLNELVKSDFPAFKIFGDGEQTRDFVHVSDIVAALILPLEREGMEGKSFNVASGKSYSLNEVISILETLSNKKIKKCFIGKRVGDIAHSGANISRLANFGHISKTTFASGLTNLYHYLNQKDLTVGKTSFLSEATTPQQ